MGSEAAVLGTNFIVIEPDTSKIDPAFDKAENAAKRAGKGIERGLGEGGGKAVDALTRRFDIAAAAGAKLARQVEESSPRMSTGYARFKGTVEALGDELNRARLAGGTLTSEQVKNFAILKQRVEEYSTAVQIGTDRVMDARTAAVAGGLEFRNLQGAFGNMFGANERFITGATVMGFAFAQAAQIAGAVVTKVNEITGAEEGQRMMMQGIRGALYWVIFGESDPEKVKASFRATFDAALFGVASLKAAVTGDWRDASALATPGSGLLAKIPSGLKLNGPYLDPAQRQGAEEKARELGRSQLAYEQQTLTLRLQNAELKKNEGQIKAISAALEENTRNQLIASGMDVEHANSIAMLTRENRELTDSEKKKAEALANYLKIQSGFLSAVHGSDFLKNDPINFLAPPKDNTQDLALSFLNAVKNSKGPSAGTLIPQLTNTEDVLLKLITDFGTWRTVGEGAATNIARSIESNLGDALFSGITGNIKGVQDAFRGLARSILSEITHMMANRLVLQFLTYLFGRTTLPTAAPTSFTTANISAKPAANGAVWQGGFTPFADGGVVKGNSFTYGLIGEKSYDEAVIPMPKGFVKAVVETPRSRQVLENHMTVMLSPDFFGAVRPMMLPTEDETLMHFGASFARNGIARQLVINEIRGR